MQDYHLLKIALSLKEQRVDRIDPRYIQNAITLFYNTLEDREEIATLESKRIAFLSAKASDIKRKSRFYAVTELHFTEIFDRNVTRVTAPLPFEYCAMVFGSGLWFQWVNDNIEHSMTRHDVPLNTGECAIPVVVVARDFPERVLILTVDYGDADAVQLDCVQLHDPKLADTLREIIISQPDVKPYVPTRGERMLMRKAYKKGPPEPFYMLKAPTSKFKDTSEHITTLCREPLSFRHDRSAHLRLLVERTFDGFEDKRLKSLRARGYVVYGPGDDLGPLASVHFLQRGHLPKEPTEWLALKVTNVRDTIVGPEDKPYLPAIRAK